MTSPLETYYLTQAGGNSAYHLLSARQKGSGLGAVIGIGARMAMPLIRSAMPYVKRGLIALGKEVLDQSVHVAGDMLSGDANLKKSVRKRAAQGASKLITGSGRAKRSRRPRRSPPPRRRTTRKQSTVKRSAKIYKRKPKTRKTVIRKKTPRRKVGFLKSALSS